MTPAPVVHLCGWPGCGKRTIARILRGLIGARLIDNHLILDPAGALFERGTAERADLRERIRDLLYEAARRLPPEVPLILTDALASTDVQTDLIEKTLALARSRRARLIPFVLKIDAAENERRLTDPKREAWDKLTDPKVLRDLRARHELLRLPGATTIDVTHLSADAAARQIGEMVDA